MPLAAYERTFDLPRSRTLSWHLQEFFVARTMLDSPLACAYILIGTKSPRFIYVHNFCALGEGVARVGIVMAPAILFGGAL
jgi:hypothetical protein